MAITITTELFNYVDTLVNSFVATNVSKVATTVAPAIAVALTLTYMMEGLFLIIRPNGEPLTSLLQRFVHSAIIISIASAGGLYQTTFSNAALKAPDEFSSVLIISNGSPTGSTNVGSIIDQALTTGVKTASTALDNAGVMSGAGLGNLVIAICCIISTAIMCGLGAGLIFMSKLMLGIVVSLGSLFIFCLLFNSTRMFFERWVAQVVTYGLTVVFMSAAFGLMVWMFNNLTKDFSNNPSASVLSGVICAIVLTIVTWFVMKEVPSLAAGLGGGVAAQSIGHTMAAFAASAAGAALANAKQGKANKAADQKADAKHNQLMGALSKGKGK